jgi:hypothetical protein
VTPEESARFEQIRAALPGYAGSLEGAYADVFFLFRLVERLEREGRKAGLMEEEQ